MTGHLNIDLGAEETEPDAGQRPPTVECPEQKGPPPAIVIGQRYRPRVCAGTDCGLPPHVRWRVAYGGYLYGLYRRLGEAIDLCDVHEREAVDVCGADWEDKVMVPRPRATPSGAG